MKSLISSDIKFSLLRTLFICSKSLGLIEDGCKASK